MEKKKAQLQFWEQPHQADIVQSGLLNIGKNKFDVWHLPPVHMFFSHSHLQYLHD